MVETNLAKARLGQIWKSPDGHEWIVSAVYDLKSSLLIDFKRGGANGSLIEKSVFSILLGGNHLTPPLLVSGD